MAESKPRYSYIDRMSMRRGMRCSQSKEQTRSNWEDSCWVTRRETLLWKMR